MKILFTGGSSFTGFWFIQELAAAGHEVTALFRKRAEDYSDDVRRQRVTIASRFCRPVHGCSFGDASFLTLAGAGSWDLLCHHAADVTNYKSPGFDAIGAVQNNTHNLPAVLDSLKSAGCSRILLTGSVFEGGDGAGLFPVRSKSGGNPRIHQDQSKWIHREPGSIHSPDGPGDAAAAELTLP